VDDPNSHLGHSFARAGGTHYHPHWIDGCRGRIVGTGEKFVVWWNNNEIKDTPFTFEAGATYDICYEGKLEDAVMGYKGKCLHVRRLVSVKARGE
jgi:hypothetical protein